MYTTSSSSAASSGQSNDFVQCTDETIADEQNPGAEPPMNIGQIGARFQKCKRDDKKKVPADQQSFAQRMASAVRNRVQQTVGAIRSSLGMKRKGKKAKRSGKSGQYCRV